MVEEVIMPGLLDVVDIKGATAVAIFVPRPTLEESASYIGKVNEQMQKVIQPKLTEYLQGLELDKKAAAIRILEELEKIRPVPVYEDFTKDIMGVVDAVEGLSLTEKVYLASMFHGFIYDQGHAWVNSILLTRARWIGANPLIIK